MITVYLVDPTGKSPTQVVALRCVLRPPPPNLPTEPTVRAPHHLRRVLRVNRPAIRDTSCQEQPRVLKER